MPLVVDAIQSVVNTVVAIGESITGGPSSSKAMSDKGNGKKPTKDVEEIRGQKAGNSSRHPEKWSPLYDSAPSQRQEKPRDRRKRVAELTLRALNRGSYEYRSATIPLGIKETVEGTIFFEENYPLNDWKSVPHRVTQRAAEATVSILNISTLDAARILHNSYRFAPQDGSAPPKTGVLNFASATQPGGGFENGAEAQEESIARVSTLVRSLKSKEGKRFYEIHQRHKSAFYTHTMIFSPDVIVFHNDQGEAVDPMPIQVVSSAAVNAGLILENKATFLTAQAEVEIEAAMEERMGRILYLFETRGIRNIVLGTFGTGVFKNKVDMVARVWAKLLVGGRFTFSFDRVFFAVTGDTTFATFKGSWEGWVKAGRNRKYALALNCVVCTHVSWPNKEVYNPATVRLGLGQGGDGSVEYGKQLYSGSGQVAGMQGFMGLSSQTGGVNVPSSATGGPRATASPEAAYKPYGSKDVGVASGHGTSVQQQTQGVQGQP